MSPIETIRVGDFTVEIHHDDSPESPREWGSLGALWTWQRRYRSPDKPALDRGDYESWEAYDDALRAEGRVVLPVYCYEHSGVAYSTGAYSDPWDSGRVGVISALRADAPEGWTDEQIEADLRAEVETYSQWANGEVYGYIVRGPDGDEIDSCWGFYDRDAWTEGRDAAEWHAKQARAAERMVDAHFAL